MTYPRTALLVLVSLFMFLPEVRAQGASAAPKAGEPMPWKEFAALADKALYSPTDEGLKNLAADIRSPFIENILAKLYRFHDMPVEKAGDLAILFKWNSKTGVRIEFGGWPHSFETVMRKKYINTLKDMCQTVVPDKYDSVYKDYRVSVSRTAGDYRIEGRALAGSAARATSFVKLVKGDFTTTFTKGEGKQARVETQVFYKPQGPKMVIDRILYHLYLFTAREGKEDLYYVVRPEYAKIRGFILPRRITLQYTDEKRAPLGDPIMAELENYRLK